ncbi:MAG: tetratricopeptide repeat protein, partial [SAR324 cluster bacterium]|nr:tetratricopeptide repeat protein [SAR324 cluster bacterium]
MTAKLPILFQKFFNSIYIENRGFSKIFITFYFIVLLVFLFSVSYTPPPPIKGDATDYLGVAQNMSFSECFFETEQDRTLNLESEYDRNIKVTGHTKIDRCFLFMHRPFLFPLLLKLFGTDNFLIFQNLLKVIVWISLSFSVFLINFRPASQFFLHVTVLFNYFNNLNYNNRILSEDTTVSYWILSFTAFILILYDKHSEKRINLYLTFLNIGIFGAVFTRDSNFLISVGYIFIVYFYIQLFFPKKNKILVKKTIYLHLLFGLAILAVSNYSTNYTARYERYIGSNLDYHLGGEYYPDKLNTDLYQKGDRNWILENYPEIMDLGVHTLEYEYWKIKNIRKMWTHYVLTHLDFFLQFNFYFYHSFLFHPILSVFMIFSLVSLLLRIKFDAKFLLLLAGMSNVIFLDYFIAVIGDNPGSIGRHINLSSKLIQFSYTLLCCYGLYVLMEFLPTFYVFVEKRLKFYRIAKQGGLEKQTNLSNDPLFNKNENPPTSIHKLLGNRRKALVLVICESVGLVIIGVFSWGSISESLFYYKGIGHYYDNQYEQMISDLDKSLFLRKLMGKPNEQIANVFHWKAQGNLNLQQYDQAIVNFSKSVEFNPSYSVSHLNLGTLFQNKGENETAIGHYTKAIETNPNLSSAYSRRGFLYMNLGKFEEAYKDLSIAIQLKPNDLLSYINRAKILMNVKQNELAVQDLEKIVRYKNYSGSSFIDPATINLFKSDAYNMLGFLAQQNGKNLDAIRLLAQSILFNSNNMPSYLNRSKLLIAEKEYERALQDLDKVLAL